jgi:hypothetical protein
MLPVVLPNTKPNNGRFQNRVPEVSFSIRLDARSQRLRSCETMPKWHDFLVINPVALAADSQAEKRTAEYRMSNNE